MKGSLLTYYILTLIVICFAMYIFLLAEAKVHYLPKETNEEFIYDEITTDIELIDANQIQSNMDKSVEKLENDAEKHLSLGKFKLTAYCSCEICCGEWAYNRPNGIVYGATGEELKEGYSIAVDPNVIPYGTEVIINGTTYKAQDCGGAIKGNRIDIYFEDHNKALEFGVQYAEVFLVK